MASGRLRAVIRALDRFIGDLVVALALETTANLRRAPSQGGTPVDTGWARANWSPTLKAPSPPKQTPAGRAGRAALVGSSIAETEARIATIATGYRLRFGPIFVSNPVAYVPRLNAGSSAQAPPNFVQKAIAEAVVSVVRRFGGRRVRR